MKTNFCKKKLTKDEPDIFEHHLYLIYNNSLDVSGTEILDMTNSHLSKYLEWVYCILSEVSTAITVTIYWKTVDFVFLLLSKQKVCTVATFASILTSKPTEFKFLRNYGSFESIQCRILSHNNGITHKIMFKVHFPPSDKILQKLCKIHFPFPS